MKKSYVYLMEEECLYDDAPSDNWMSATRAYSSLKKSIEHLKFWADVHESVMRSKGELPKDGNYVTLDINEDWKLGSRLFVRKGVELRIISIKRVFLF